MDNRQFAQLVRELETIKKLLILNTLKSGANQGEVAKLLALSDRQIRNILAGE